MAYVYIPRKPLAVSNTTLTQTALHWDYSNFEEANEDVYSHLAHDTDFVYDGSTKLFVKKNYVFYWKKYPNYMSHRLLYHGTKYGHKIIEQGFDLQQARFGMFGDGVYFANNWRKSYQYGHCMLLVEVRTDNILHCFDEADRAMLTCRMLNEHKTKSLQHVPVAGVHAHRSKPNEVHFLYNDEWCMYSENQFKLVGYFKKTK